MAGLRAMFGWRTMKKNWSLFPIIGCVGGAVAMCFGIMGYSAKKNDVVWRPSSYRAEDGRDALKPMESIDTNKYHKLYNMYGRTVQLDPEYVRLKQEMDAAASFK